MEEVLRVLFDLSKSAYADMNPTDATQMPQSTSGVFHTHNKSDAPQVDFMNLKNKLRYALYRIIDPTTGVSVATTVGGNFVWPFAGSLMEIGATVDTAGVTGNMTIDVKKNGVSIFTTNLINIPTASTTSRSSTIASNITTNGFVIGDIYTFDVTVVQSTPALGLMMYMNVIQI